MIKEREGIKVKMWALHEKQKCLYVWQKKGKTD